MRVLGGGEPRLFYVLRRNAIPFTDEEVGNFIDSWKELIPFEDVIKELSQLKEHHQLVVLSNGEDWFPKYLVKNRVRFDFDRVISAQTVGVFKPHPELSSLRHFC